MKPGNSTARLRWRCRRGIKEMDLLLARFLEQNYPLLNADEQALFENLLEEADLDIYAWIMDKASPDNQNFLTVINRLRRMTDE